MKKKIAPMARRWSAIIMEVTPQLTGEEKVRSRLKIEVEGVFIITNNCSI